MAKTDQELAQDILDGEGINWRYGGDTIAGALMPFRREVITPEQSQFIGYDSSGNAIIQNIPAQYGETQYDINYSPLVRGAKTVGSSLRDIFFGDANQQAEAVGEVVSALRGAVGGVADYASGQYQAALGGGTVYNPNTQQVTEFDPTAVMLSNAPAGFQAVRNATPNTMTLGAAGGKMQPPRDIHTEVANAKAAYDLDPNNDELRKSYIALRKERDATPSAPRLVRGKGSAIPVYHGSPHKFNQFSMDAIGTGEGAQAYGYGLYFADSPAVARSYRDQLSESSGTIDGRSIMDDYNIIIDRADSLPPASAQIEYDKAAFLEDLALTDDIAESISRIENPEVAQWARREVSPKFEPAGYTYEANLNVTADDLLDLELPLNQQPAKVQTAFDELMKLNGFDSYIPKDTGSKVYLGVGDSIDLRGRDVYKIITEQFGASPSSASQYLSDAGVKGIRYLDQDSRNRGGSEGSRNYVIFDDSVVDTKRVNDKPTESWMNPEARMQRAQDLGFDTDNVFYHGTASDFAELQPSTVGDLGGGVYVTPNPEKASGYAAVRKFMKRQTNNAGPNVLPLRVKSNLNYLDLEGSSIMPFDETRIQSLKDQGYEGIRQFDADGNVIQMNIFDPKNIRSTNAEFDPTKADSADLLSSVGTTSALRGIA